jgi:predicted acetyltransferase
MKQTPGIEIYPASIEDMPVIENLLEYYTYEFSESAHLDVGLNGRFGYDDLDDYWKDDSLYPYLMTIGGKYCGLALVQPGSVGSGKTGIWDMEDFFIMHRYRRRGLGTELARHVWHKHPGQWEIRVLDGNTPALQFWSAAATDQCKKVVTPSKAIVNGNSGMYYHSMCRSTPDNYLGS